MRLLYEKHGMIYIIPLTRRPNVAANALPTASRSGGPVGRHVRDPDHLRARADDHPRRRSLLAGASSAQAAQALAGNATAS